MFAPLDQKKLDDSPADAIYEQKGDILEEEDLSIDPIINRAVLRKFDGWLLPIAFLLYLFSSLDRNNLGNAKTDGMTTDLNFPTNGYSIVLSTFYAPFCLFCVPGGMLTKRIGAKYTIPTMMFAWGSMALLNAACTSYAGVLVVRLLLGVFEAAFPPSLIFYLTTFYRRGEIAKRIALYYTGNALSGAFSGLISYGVFHIAPNAKFKGWQVLFTLEGGVTILIAIAAYFVLPKSVAEAKFLTPEEKEVARRRILQDSSDVIDKPYSHADFFASLKDPKFYPLCLIAFCYGTGSATASNFLPTIVARLGYSVVKTNLYTVAPNIVGAVVLLITATSSDFFRERTIHLTSALCLTFTGCVILAAIDTVTHPQVSYFACFLIAMGAYTPTVIFHSWHSGNEMTESGRAFRLSILNLFANAPGLVSANIFRAKDAPNYIPALALTGAFEGACVVIVLSYRAWMMYDNAKRDRIQGLKKNSKDTPTYILQRGAKDINFRHFL